jgi:hypothetical protein
MIYFPFLSEIINLNNHFDFNLVDDVYKNVILEIFHFNQVFLISLKILGLNYHLFHFPSL